MPTHILTALQAKMPPLSFSFLLHIWNLIGRSTLSTENTHRQKMAPGNRFKTQFKFSANLINNVLGAFFGGFSEQLLSGYVSQVVLAIISIALTITITVVLLKIDLSQITEKILKKVGWRQK